MSIPAERIVDDKRSESEKKLEDMLQKFERDNKDVEAAKNLRTLIDGSDTLRANMLAAIENGKLKNFVIDVTPEAVHNRYSLESEKLSVSQKMLTGIVANEPGSIASAAELLNREIGPALLTPQQRLDALVTDFEAAHKDGKNPDRRVRDAIESSPALKQQLLDATDAGYLTTIVAKTSLNDKVGGGYAKWAEGGRISLPAKILDDDKELLFTLGHESEHAKNKHLALEADRKFQSAVSTTVKNGGKTLDFTQAMEDKIDYHRNSEAKAHIAGFNAIASKTFKDNPQADLGDIYKNFPEGRKNDFFESSGKLRSGLEFDKTTGTIVPNEKNVLAMGKIYFDKSPEDAGLGNKKNLDNKHLYASRDMLPHIFSAVENSKNKDIPVALDLKRLGLSETMLESNISFPDNKPRPYINTSDGKQDQRQFDPGIKNDLKKNAPATPKIKSGQTSESADDSPERETPRRPDRAYGDDDARYFAPAGRMPATEETRRMGALLDAHLKSMADMSPTERDNLIAAAASKSITGGLKNMDLVALSQDGKTVFVMDGLQEHSRRVDINVADAIRQPYEQSVATIDRYQKQQSGAEPAQDQEQQRAPRMA